MPEPGSPPLEPAAGAPLWTELVAEQPLASTEVRPDASGASSGAALAVMLLADGRFPVGGHAHSAGAEAACADGRIVDEATLATFVEGRLHRVPSHAPRLRSGRARSLVCCARCGCRPR